MHKTNHLFRLIQIASVLIGLTLANLNAQRQISGIVLDESGQPLIGANVTLKDTPLGTATDNHGIFNLDLPQGSYTLVASYIGYDSSEVAIGASNYIEITLKVNYTGLDEVVIEGFGQTTARKLTSSVSSVESDVYNGASKINFQQALQGQLPGVLITQNSGAVNSDMAIRIRGQTSINASNQPLFVIDDIVFEGISGSIFGGSATTPTNPLINIDPNEIESVHVLKDGAASAIYGSRGSNGVVIIKTKRGSFDTKPHVNFSYQVGFNKPSKSWDMMDGENYAKYWNQAAANEDYGEEWMYTEGIQPNTVWNDLLTRSAVYHELAVGVRGGSSSTKYALGASYRNQDDYFITKGLKRYGLRFNIDQLLGKKWATGLTMHTSYVNNDRYQNGQLPSAVNANIAYSPPNVEAYDEDGNPIDLLTGELPQIRTWQSPLVDILETETILKRTQILAGTYLSYSPVQGLELKTTLGYEYTAQDEFFYASSNTWWGRSVNGLAGNETRFNNNLTWTNTATYAFHKGFKNDFTVMAGHQFQQRTSTYSYVEGSNFPDDDLKHLSNAGVISNGLTSEAGHAFVGYFGRLNYARSRKYFITVSGRYDGSSRFGQNKRYGFFPAISAAWLISDESFFNPGWIDHLKISTSFGKTGNAEIGDYDHLSLVGYGFNYKNEPGAQIINLGDENLTWEETSQLDISLHFGLCRSRLSGSVSYFLKNTDGLLLEVPVSGVSGVWSLLRNAGAVRNQGVELELNSRFQLSNEFSLEIGINAATLQNEVIRLIDTDGDGLDNDISAGWYRFRVGEPLGSWYMQSYAGVDPQNGDALFYDKQSNATNSYSDADRTFVGNSMPKFAGGGHIRIDFKGFYFLMRMQFATGYSMFTSERIFLEDNFTSGTNQLNVVSNAWTEDNVNTVVPELRLGVLNGSQTSTRYLHKADYFRIKNIQLGYVFKNIGNSKSNITTYISGDNLLLLTGYPGLDPEVDHTSSSSSLRGLSTSTSSVPFGLSFGISAEF